jgi:hypothetical protein
VIEKIDAETVRNNGEQVSLGNIKKSCKDKSEFVSIFSTMLSMNKYNIIKMEGG